MHVKCLKQDKPWLMKINMKSLIDSSRGYIMQFVGLHWYKNILKNKHVCNLCVNSNKCTLFANKYWNLIRWRWGERGGLCVFWVNRSLVVQLCIRPKPKVMKITVHRKKNNFFKFFFLRTGNNWPRTVTT